MPKVFINPGHDIRIDPGAVGPSGLHEAVVALSVGKLVAKYLEDVNYKTIIVQSDALTRDVINVANAQEVDVFVSIHCNSFANSQANGTETLYFTGSTASARLAKCIQKQMISEFGLTDRGIKERGDLGVLRKTDMPAVLAEMAFISNPEEEQLLADEQDRWAKCIARGITDYFA